MEFLPSIVRDFSLISNNEGFEDNLETGYIKEHCAKWLDNIHEILTKVPFINYVSTFKGEGVKNVNFCSLLGPCLPLHVV